jgi:hypothetical protein
MDEKEGACFCARGIHRSFTKSRLLCLTLERHNQSIMFLFTTCEKAGPSTTPLSLDVLVCGQSNDSKVLRRLLPYRMMDAVNSLIHFKGTFGPTGFLWILLVDHGIDCDSREAHDGT